MLQYQKELVLSQATEGIILQGVNCKGAYGAGFSGYLARHFPKVEDVFRAVGASDKLLGTIVAFPVTPKLIVANCYTQLTYGSKGKHASVEAIDQCLHSVDSLRTQMKLTVYTPIIGCGLGGLDWESEVLPVFELHAVLSGYTIVELFK